MGALTIAMLAFLFVTGVAYLTGAVLLRRWSPVQQQRLRRPEPQAGPASILRWEERSRAGWQRTVERLGRAFGPRDNAKLARVRERLACAGYHDPRAIRFFIGAKVGLAILFGYAYTLYGLFAQRALSYVPLISFVLAGLGFFLVNYWLSSRIRARQREIVHALPDVLDLLMVCVEAGMGFDAAVARVAEQPEMRQSPFHQELLRMHLEVRAGRPREEALRALGERTGVQEVKTMVAAFIQTERLGTALGKTLRVHAESARVQRRLRAEERAYLAPLKMLFPTVVFLFPAYFLVALAPALLRLMVAFKAIGQ
ncbi:MAG: type II secretion system F family protein [Candidatus Methylomirabilia bacterium]